MRSRLTLRLAVLLASAIACAGAATAQTRRPPVPAPLVREFVLCGARLEELFTTGVDGRRDDADRATAAELIEALYQRERDRLTDRVEDELGPFAWSLFVPGDIGTAQLRFEELRAPGCVRQALVRGRESADPLVRGRSQELLDRYEAPVGLAESFFMDGASDPTGSTQERESALRVELPPAELIVPGGSLAGRVVLDLGIAGAADGASLDALADGLVAQMGDQTVAVGRDGLFVLRAPRQAGTYSVEVRHQQRPLLVPVVGLFTVARHAKGGASAEGGSSSTEGVSADELPPRPAVACPGFVDYLDAVFAGDAGAAAPADCSVVAPRVILPDQRLVLLGRLGDGSGRAMRAFVGPWEVPLLAKTPIAAIFDVSAVPAGLHPLALYEGGALRVTAPVHRVLLTATSDRSEIARGEMATFSVRVEGLPRSLSGIEPDAAANGAGAPLAFLDYVNKSPEAGRFRDPSSQSFTVPIARSDLGPEPAPLRSEDHRSLGERIERLAMGPPPARPETSGEASGSAPPAPPDAAGIAEASASTGSFDDVQHYRGTGNGEFHVQVVVRVGDGAARLAPAIVAPPFVPRSSDDEPQRPAVPANTVGSPLAETGLDERGVFAQIDGQKLYFSISTQMPVPPAEPPAQNLFAAACSGTCQCSIQSWDHAGEVGAQVAALDRSRPGWRAVTASTEVCGCDEARAQCYAMLSLECRTRCKRLFESRFTDFVSGFAIDAKVGECGDRGVCSR